MRLKLSQTGVENAIVPAGTALAQPSGRPSGDLKTELSDADFDPKTSAINKGQCSAQTDSSTGSKFDAYMALLVALCAFQRL